MQYNFLGFSVSKMMELNLDMKDMAILRYFVDFRETGKMNYEIVEGEKYYWINYKSIEEEMPYLSLGKRAIMLRMLKLKDLGILIHYTKKEGGTYSFYNLGDKYNELININKEKVTKNKYESNKYENEDMYEEDYKDELNKDEDRYEEDYEDKFNKDKNRYEEDYEDKFNKDKNRYEEDYEDKFNKDEDRYEEGYEDKFNEDKNRYEEDYEDKFNEDKNRYEKDYEDRFNKDEDRYEEDYENKLNKEEDSFLEIKEEKKDKQSRGKQEEENRQEKNTKQYNVQEKEQYLYEISDYVQDYAQGVHENEIAVCTDMSKGCVLKGRTKTLLLNNSSTKETNIKKYIKKEIEEIVEYLNKELGTNYKPNFKNTIKLINARLTEGFRTEDFKTVIDKKVKDWTGTEYEEYLTPTTLFGDKFEKYLNQKVVIVSDKTRYKNNYEIPKLRFNNFTGREYDYEELEKKLLGW